MVLPVVDAIGRLKNGPEIFWNYYLISIPSPTSKVGPENITSKANQDWEGVLESYSSSFRPSKRVTLEYLYDLMILSTIGAPLLQKAFQASFNCPCKNSDRLDYTGVSMRIAFQTNQLSERGTEIALYEYASLNETILGNTSIILFNRDNPHNIDAVFEKFSYQFPTFGYRDAVECDEIIRRENCDLLYAIGSGKGRAMISRTVPTMVHDVFMTSPTAIRGSSYAYISRWLSDYCSDGLIPYVPLTVSRVEVTGDFRIELGIPSDAFVFGCYGGNKSFDIGFVKNDVIPDILRKRDDIHFVFMNIEKFCDHERVHFLPRSVDNERSEERRGGKECRSRWSPYP